MDFVAKFENGKLKFATRSMEALWNRHVDFYTKSGSFFKLTIENVSKSVTDGQVSLFKRICIMVSEDTGNDYKVVWDEFLKLTPLVEKRTLLEVVEKNKQLQDMNTTEFQLFLEKVLVMANDIMGCNLQMHVDERIGTIITLGK